MKMLVAIANYGIKNQVYLNRLIDEYVSMTFEVDIVVLSNIPKDLGPNIEVQVGFPGKNPWNLPFPHKQIFADRLKDYDLFIYSEDDTLIRQENIEAYLKVTKVLPENEIVGFLRYEEDTDGKKYCSSIHSHFHWDPGSVNSVGKYTFARLTNAHSACYILTKEQLQRAIGSGGYLVSPHKGRYGLLETAATDPYTQCGLRKMICISHINDFLLHHLPNQYIGRLGIELEEVQAQINALRAISNDKRTQGQLFSTETKLNECCWDKLYYEKCREDILTMISDHPKNILSIGCGCGATEARLVQNRVRVVGIPLDHVIAESAKRKGIEVLTSDFKLAEETLANEEFDCLLFVDVLQHLPDPRKILMEYTKYLDKSGYVIISVPNFKYIKYYYEVMKIGRVYRNGELFKRTNIHFTTSKMVAQWIYKSELEIINVNYVINNNKLKWLGKITFGLLNKYFAKELLICAKRT